MAKHVLSLFVMHIKRNSTPLKYIGYGLYLYFLGLSNRNTSKALSQFVKRSHVAVWKWIQKYHPKRIISTRKKIEEYLVDETLIKVGSGYELRLSLKQTDSRIIHIHGKKYADSRKVSLKRYKTLWKTSSFY